MKFLFLTNPAYGHLNPLLGIMGELIKRGNKVVAYNTREFAEKIKQTGAEFREPPFKIEKFDLRQMNSAANIAEKVLDLTNKAVPGLTKILRVEKFDCLLHDSVSLWGKIAGIKNKIPSVSLVPSMGINLKVMLTFSKYLSPDYLQLAKRPLRTLQIFHNFRAIYKQIGKGTPLIFDLFVNKEKLNVVFTSEYFQSCRESFDSSFKFVGPIIFDRHEEPVPLRLLQTDKPIIYVSLGTAFNDDITFYKTLINSFTQTPYLAFISIGSYMKSSDLGKIPENVYVKSYLPQLEILKKASLFVSHGGMNSVNESLFFGVPMLLLPIIQEQHINSARVEELGAGIYCKKSGSNEDVLRTIMNKILTTELYKKKAEKIRETLVMAGGLQTAVEYILDFTNKN